MKGILQGFSDGNKGFARIKESAYKGNEMVEQMHGITLPDLLVGTNSFTFPMRLNAIMKVRREMDGTYLCICKVKDGKIVA